MKKTYQYLFGASLALATFSFIGNASAQSCATPPTCESLGYEFTADDCADRPSLKCPFDTSKIFCVSATEAGETRECLNVGDILYSDMTCSSPDNLVKGKTPIAIVVSPLTGKAMALEQKQAKWSKQEFEIPGLTSYDDAPITDTAGKSNTKIIVDYCKAKNKSCPAAEYAYSYRTVGTQEGDWYLPAGGELQDIYNNNTKINTTLTSLGKPALSSACYWSSNVRELLSSLAWGASLLKGYWNDYEKYDSCYIRPMIQF